MLACRVQPGAPQPFLIQPTRATQPYRQGAPRAPGQALSAMLAGRPGFLPNPMDYQRGGGLADLLARIRPSVTYPQQR